MADPSIKLHVDSSDIDVALAKVTELHEKLRAIRELLPVFISCERPIPPSEIDRIRVTLTAGCPGLKFVILTHGMKLEGIGEQEEPR